MDKKKLLIKFHTVCSNKGMTADEKDSLLEGAGVESSKELSEAQLSRLIDKLQDGLKDSEADRWRKRVMGVIGSWLRNRSMQDSDVLIKAIACQAAGTDNFNKISITKLTRIYAEWREKEKTIKAIGIVKQQILDYVAIRN